MDFYIAIIVFPDVKKQVKLNQKGEAKTWQSTIWGQNTWESSKDKLDKIRYEQNDIPRISLFLEDPDTLHTPLTFPFLAKVCFWFHLTLKGTTKLEVCCMQFFGGHGFGTPSKAPLPTNLSLAKTMNGEVY